MHVPHESQDAQGKVESVFQRKYLETGPQKLKRNELVLLLGMHMSISSGEDQVREPKKEEVGMEFCMPGMIAPKDPWTFAELLLSWGGIVPQPFAFS